MTTQLEDERAALLGRKRAEQAARRRAQDDLERILAENQRKVLSTLVRASCGSIRV